jgi:hypothetical protein
MVRDVPVQVEQSRRKICGRCLARCPGFLSGSLRLDLAASRCPHPAGARWAPFLPGAPVVPPTLGAGTAFSYLARPVARVADAVLRTNLANCPGCADRKVRWDRKVPDIIHPWRRG